MVILEYLYALILIVLFIALILLIIALAIPAALLYLVYWIIFKSWRKKNAKVVKTTGVDKEKLLGVINQAMHAKDNPDFDKEAFQAEIQEFVDETLEANDIEKE